MDLQLLSAEEEEERDRNNQGWREMTVICDIIQFFENTFWNSVLGGVSKLAFHNLNQHAGSGGVGVVV